MNIDDLLGGMDVLKEIIEEAASSAAPTEQPRMRYEEPVKRKTLQNDADSFADEPVDELDPDAYDQIDFQPTPAPQQAYSPAQPDAQFASDGAPGLSHADRKSGELSSYELGQIVMSGQFWEFALGILMKTYNRVVAKGPEEEAKFIRTDVQRFVQQMGRHNFERIPYGGIQKFVDECVRSRDILDYEDYLTEKMLREDFHKSGTVNVLVKNANSYYERAREDIHSLDNFDFYNDRYDAD